MRFFKLFIFILFLCAVSSCAGKELKDDHVASVSLGMDQILQILIDRKWPTSPELLASDLGVKFSRIENKSGFQQTFRTPNFVTSDGHKIEYIEYRLPDLNRDQMIRYLRIPLNQDHCYSILNAKQKFLTTKEHVIPPEHGSSEVGNSISYSRDMDGYKMSFWTSDANRKCVESISFQVNP